MEAGLAESAIVQPDVHCWLCQAGIHCSETPLTDSNCWDLPGVDPQIYGASYRVTSRRNGHVTELSGI